MLVDLHIHTYYSDGTMSPKEVVEDAKRKNLGIIAITDHDVLDSYEELKVEAEKAGIIAIRGVEIDSIFEGHLVHLLAYKFEDNEKLFKLINHAKEQLLETSIELIRRMENDYEGISLEDYNSYEYENTIIVGTRGWTLGDDDESKKMINREVARLELSIKNGIETYGEDKEIIAFMHYPPILKQNIQNNEMNEFIRMLKKYDIKKCYYGHIHGKQIGKKAITGFHNGIDFHMISSDQVGFVPVLVF